MFDVTDFQKSLKILKNNNELSDFQKVRAFYQLCDKHKVEPILSRLSGRNQESILKYLSYYIY